MLNTKSSTYFQIEICLSQLVRHKFQKPMNLDTSILTSAVNFKPYHNLLSLTSIGHMRNNFEEAFFFLGGGA